MMPTGPVARMSECEIRGLASPSSPDVATPIRATPHSAAIPRVRSVERSSVMAVEINCDMGEGFGLYRMGDDEALMPLIGAANVACGFHGSDPSIMRATVRLAKQHSVKVGAHPSLPDLQGFGRRAMAITPAEVSDLVT